MPSSGTMSSWFWFVMPVANFFCTPVKYSDIGLSFSSLFGDIKVSPGVSFSVMDLPFCNAHSNTVSMFPSS